MLDGDSVVANKIFLFANPANNGNVYLGLQNMNKTTLEGVIAVLVGSLGTWDVVNNVGMNIYQCHQMWVDADNSGEGLAGSIDQV